MSTKTSKSTFNKLEFLKLMMISREGDRREGILLRQSKGWFQVSGMGHEALGALAYLLREDDYLFPYYRDRGLMLARGLSNRELALAYFAKREGSSGGRQMPGHYSSRKHNVFSVCTLTGGNCLPACGTAWGMKMDGKDSVAIATIGDAAARQGEFYEAWAFAVQEKLPVIFILEDNKYGISTPTEKFMPFHLPLFDSEAIVKVDGRRPDDILEAGRTAIDKARKGDGPTMIWLDLDRLSSHTSSDDHRVYRDLNEIEEMQHRDPIRLLSEELLKSGALTEAAFQAMQDEVFKLVDEDYIAAEKADDPIGEETMRDCWGDEVNAEAPPIAPGRQTMVSAINTTFRKALENDPKIVFFGEDIEDPKGGVFGVTKGLSEAFPKQVFNSPLAEATIMGVAVGLSAYGWRPVFELQFIDFIAPGWNQITGQMSTLRWRSFGEWKCPLVIYAPYGAYLPGGSLWHSQSNEASLAHVPGIRVAIPSTPQDAAGLLWSAIHGDDPTFVLVPKHIFRMQIEVDNVEPVPFGVANVVQEGTDVTIVTYGNTMELVHEAVAKSGVSCEIIDLRSIVPCDYETITESVAKTGRLVVVHEDTKTCGFGQSIISEMVSVPERFNLFLSPPQLVCRDDVHIGYNPIYEYAALPDVDQVISAINLVME
ncbi:MAG: thiamine pyrophosphate-dependent enzyme [Fimbriimonas sp.]|jgi:2-oxoisovalerate dehydrogenase E1 component|nr:thiamine pyrophosphate-dependent enzyme [Fimbriimonas sp.]